MSAQAQPLFTHWHRLYFCKSFPVAFSFPDFLFQANPKLSVVVDLTNALNSFGAATVYLIVIAGTMPDAVRYIALIISDAGAPDMYVSCLVCDSNGGADFSPVPPSLLRRELWLLIFMAPAVYLASKRRLDEFRGASYIAIGTLLFIIVIVLVLTSLSLRLYCLIKSLSSR